MGHSQEIQHDPAPRISPHERVSRREDQSFARVMDETVRAQHAPSNPHPFTSTNGGAHPELTETNGGESGTGPVLTFGPDEGEIGIGPDGELDEIRQGIRDEQQTALENIHNSDLPGAELLAPEDQANLNENRETNLDALTGLIVDEIDYAATQQAVPDFDALAESIQAEAPDDPYLARAVEQARTILEARWEQQGRTADQIGALLEVGENGTPAEITAEAQRQLETLGEELAAELGEDATPEAITTALLERAGVYATYLPDGASAQTWNAAIQTATEQAVQKLLVDPEIEEVLEAAETGGEDWAEQAMDALREATDPQTHTPQQVLAILDDPRIQSLIQDALSGADSLGGDGGAGYPDSQEMLVDFSAVAQAAFMAGDKGFVDDAAAFFTDEVLAKIDDPLVEGALLSTLVDAASEGNIAFGLSLAARDPDSAIAGVSILDRIASGLADFRTRVEQQQSEAVEHAAFITVPMQTWGQNLTPEEQAAALEGLLASNPEEAQQLIDDGERQLLTAEQIAGMDMAFQAWSPSFGDDPRFAGTVDVFGEIPRVDEGMFPAELTGAVPAAGEPGALNPWWFLRSLRASGSFIAQQFSSAHLPANIDESLWRGSPDTGDVRPAARFDKGLSAWLFGQNALSLWGGEPVDAMYVLPHTAMAAMHGTNALLPDAIKADIFGIDANGNSAAFNSAYAAANTAIDGLRVADGTRDLLRTIAAGALKDPLDVVYIGTDATAAISYFTGWDAMVGEGAEPDPVRGVAFSISTLSDTAFILGSAAAFTGGTVFGLGATAWTGVGAALFVVASGLNLVKGQYDRAHEYDGENAAFLEQIGVRPEIAEQLAQGSYYADGDAWYGAGPFLTAAFHEAGYTTEEMVAFMNQWTPEQADKVATYIKMEIDQPEGGGGYTAEQFAEVAEWAAATTIGVGRQRRSKDPIPYPTAVG